MPSKFDIRIRSEVRIPSVSVAYLKKTAAQILKLLKWKKAALSVLLVGDPAMRRYNRQYLGHDRTTDVIAFPETRTKRVPGNQAVFLGDIVISIPTTRRQAQEYGNSFKYELCFYLCHAILHLMGYCDKTQKEALQMDRKQKRILKKIGIHPVF